MTSELSWRDLPPMYFPRRIDELLVQRSTDTPDGCGFAAEFRSTGKRQSVTFLEWERRSSQLAAGLVGRAGVTPGDRVAWFLANEAAGEALILYHAVIRAHAVNVPINTRLTPREIAHILQRSGCSVCVVDSALAEPVTSALDRLDQPVARYSVGEPVAGFAGIDTLFSEDSHPLTAGDTSAVASLLYTSGTTGRPRAAVHTHGSSLAAAIGWADAFRLQPSDVLQSPFPVFTGAGLHFNGLSSLWSGATFVVDGTDPAQALQLVEEHGTTVYVAVPSIYQFWLDGSFTGSADTSSVRILDYGGASMAPSVIRRLRQAFPAAGLMQTYGLTEAGPGGLYLAEEYALTKLGSVGNRTAGAFTSFRVVDETGGEVGPNTVGELLLRGPSLMREYLDDPEATAATTTVDGWLRTGDLVRVDRDGFVFHVDRTKDIIVRGGYNVSSAEVESVLHEHPDVADVAVIGRPHPRLGEEVEAVLVVRDPMVSESQILDFCRERLADFKVPRHVTFRDDLPRNASGKILKRVLREQITAAADG